MSQKLNELIDELSKEFVKEEPKEDEEKKKEKEFFFGKVQTSQMGDGRCVRCYNEMRIHLSTFICDNCEGKNV